LNESDVTNLREKNRLMEITEVLNELKGLWGIPTPETKLSWDSRRKLFRGPDSKPTLHSLSGGRMVNWARFAKSSILSLGKLNRGCTTKLVEPILSIKAPGDTIMLPLKNRTGFVVASKKAGLVIKIGMNEERSRSLDYELDAWEIAKQAKISDRVATLYTSGKSNHGARWLLSELVANSKPFRNGGGHDWLCHLKSAVLPTLQSFYEASGVEIIDTSNTLDAVEGNPIRVRFEHALSEFRLLVERSRDGQEQLSSGIVVAQVHGDLFPKHVHRNNDCWKLIDFGRSNRKPVINEYFQIYVDHIFHESSGNNIKAFWNWLLMGDEKLLSYSTKREMAVFIDWYAEWRGCPFSAANLRFQILFHLYMRLTRVAKSEKMQSLPATDTIEKLLCRSDSNYSIRHFFSTLNCLKCF